MTTTVKKQPKPIPSYEVWASPLGSANSMPYMIGEIKARSEKRAMGAARIFAIMKRMKVVAVKLVGYEVPLDKVPHLLVGQRRIGRV